MSGARKHSLATLADLLAIADPDRFHEIVDGDRWMTDGFLLVQSAEQDERIRAEPFDEVSFSVRGLLDGDDEE